MIEQNMVKVCKKFDTNQAQRRITKKAIATQNKFLKCHLNLFISGVLFAYFLTYFEIEKKEVQFTPNA